MTQWPQQLQAKLYPARFDRQIIADLLTPGVRGLTELVVTADGGSRSVDVSTGCVYVDGTQDAAQGAYRMLYDSITELAIASCTTYPRLDQIIARMYDSEYGGTDNMGTLEVLPGVETSGATLTNRLGAASTLPPNSLLIYDVLAPVGSGVLSSGEIADRRAFVGKGPRYFSGTAANLSNIIPVPIAGDLYYVTDATPPVLTQYNGSAWGTAMIAGPWIAPTNYPAIANLCEFRIVGDRVELKGSITNITGSTIATPSSLLTNLPEPVVVTREFVVYVGGAGAATGTVNASGQFQVSVNWLNSSTIPLENISYSLT